MKNQIKLGKLEKKGKSIVVNDLEGKEVKLFRYYDRAFIYTLADFKQDYNYKIVNESEFMEQILSESY